MKRLGKKNERKEKKNNYICSVSKYTVRFTKRTPIATNTQLQKIIMKTFNEHANPNYAIPIIQNSEANASMS